MSVFTIEDIMNILPHRPPFLLVDSVEELEPGVKAVGKKCVTMNEPFFTGHFPGKPVMPGVLIVEAMAQVGAVAVLCAEENRGKLAFLAGVNNAKFKRKVIPGDVLMMECVMIKRKGGIGVAQCCAKVDGQLAAKADITFAIG